LRKVKPFIIDNFYIFFTHKRVKPKEKKKKTTKLDKHF